MHRRARHLNAYHAGAAVSLDARFLSGLSNNDPVSTWTNRTGSNDFTGSGTTRPLYTTSSISGNPAITFDGVDDVLTNSSASQYTNFILLYVTRLNRSGPYTSPSRIDIVASSSVFNSSSPGSGGFNSFLSNGFGSSSNTWVSTEKWVGSSKTEDRIVNGVDLASASSAITVGSANIVGSVGTGVVATGNSSILLGKFSTFFGKIDLAYVAYFPVNSASIRRRFEQSVSLSYKIACS